ncbi:hypothetical protein MUN74_12955 [Agromyces endophyticus]|uniref:hypothetical protein n=1 Tax=Agromyces sp. H17E-10 TaxID=2932244 RepID=UPI001FD459E4|nr:hypothetical protein [Agromyces sp. H17E-10]UOQ88191.1 hypothetical protein MUN74_12955 [Agromyces sp. H17E-10]
MSQPTTGTRLSRSDQAGMYMTIVLGAVGIAITLWVMVQRLLEVLPGRDVPVLVPFVDETAPLPIGPGGAAVDVAVDQAIVTVPQPAAATQFAIIAQPIVVGVAIVAGIVLLGLLCWNLARGRAFTRQNTRIVWTGAAVLTVGWVFGSLFTTMSVNGALAAVSDHTYDGVLFSTDFTAMFGLLALGVVGAAFQIGERLQRDTEGLV